MCGGGWDPWWHNPAWNPFPMPITCNIANRATLAERAMGPSPLVLQGIRMFSKSHTGVTTAATSKAIYTSPLNGSCSQQSQNSTSECIILFLLSGGFTMKCETWVEVIKFFNDVVMYSPGSPATINGACVCTAKIILLIYEQASHAMGWPFEKSARPYITSTWLEMPCCPRWFGTC